jgi:hypothetical protein
MKRPKPEKPASPKAKAQPKSAAQPATGRAQRRQRGLASASSAMGEAARDEDARQPRSRTGKGKPQPSTRVGKKGLVLYVLPEITRALRKLAAENDTDVQSMGRRALELLFAEYGRPLPGAGASRKT